MAIGTIIASATDIALVVEAGIIRDVALGNDELKREGYHLSWRNKPWVQTVTAESRPKIEDLLHAPAGEGARWRQVNHPSVAGPDVPIQYKTVEAGSPGRLVALGRDLRGAARLQQRLVEAHQSLERDYSRLRETEARYKLLFQAVSQPILIADPATLTILDANPAAATLLDARTDALVGGSLAELFAERSRPSAASVVADSVSLGSASVASLRLRGGRACNLSVSAFRERETVRAIVRLDTEWPDGRAPQGTLLSVLEELPDGLIVASADLRILAANRAFLEMAQLSSRGQAASISLPEVLGRSLSEINVMVATLRSHGVVLNFATVLRDRVGNELDVEVSAVAASHSDQPLYGFSVRNTARRLRAAPQSLDTLPTSTGQLTQLVGRVPLREIVRESTDVIEKLCIRAALEITDDNRASAADMLGLSRQALYSKLRRFGLENASGTADGGRQT